MLTSVAQVTNSTSQNSGSFDFYGMTAAEVITLTVFNGCIATIGSVSNILLIIAVLLTRQLREICTAVLLISLSLNDVIICAVYQPMNILDINYGSSAITEAVRFRLGFGLFLASITGELIVTLDRFIYIRFPYLYLDWTSTKYVVVSAFCAQWLLAILLTLLTFTSGLIYMYTGAVYITGVLVSTLALHISIYCTARRKTRQSNSQYPTASQKSVFWNKSTAVVIMTVIVTLLCWAPIIILPAAVPPSSPSFKRYVKLVLPFNALSAALDPFLFCWRLNDFRMALVACLRRLRRSFHFGK